jgi:acyl carrier protein
MADSIETRVRQVAADVFSLPLERITPETSPQSIENWDSVQHLNLVLALEGELGVRLDPEDIEKMTTIGNIIALVKQKASS